MSDHRRAAGLDWGNAKIAAALWSDGVTRIVKLADGRAFVPAAVAFQGHGRQRPVSVHFPLADAAATTSDSLIFPAIKSKLPLLGDDDVQAFVAKSIFEYWRTILVGRDLRLSVSVPFDYSSHLCRTLQAAAVAAGFRACNSVPEPLAAVLAHLPRWLKEPARLQLIRKGVCTWVVDCGYLDLAISVLHLRLDHDAVHVAYLAADSLDGLGAAFADQASTGDSERLQAAVTHLLETAFSVPWPDWRGPRPDPDAAAWLVPSGGGGLLGMATAGIVSRLPGETIVAGEILAAEVVARGCAVHAAIHGGMLNYRVHTKRRMIIGLKTEGPNGKAFTAMTTLGDGPPCRFESAFSIDSGGGRGVEVSLAAALPGGGKHAGLWSAVLSPQDVGRMGLRVILVSGHLDDWSGGSVSIRDAVSGTTLSHGRFQLPG